MRRLLLLSALLPLFISNCAPTNYVKFDDIKSDMITTNELKLYLAETDKPNIVLRVPETEEDLTEESSTNLYSSYYNTIEKEFLRSGFNVRDRALFNQIISKNRDENNYSELQNKTDTDLIIELVSIDTKVRFGTNTYYTESNQQKTFENNQSLSAYGAKIEFKIVLIKTNQYAGSYLFYYQPCPRKCPIKISSQSAIPRFVNYEKRKQVNEENKNEDPYQYVSKSAFDNFIKNATKQLIGEMRNGK